jgi:hypothetical protein
MVKGPQDPSGGLPLGRNEEFTRKRVSVEDTDEDLLLGIVVDGLKARNSLQAHDRSIAALGSDLSVRAVLVGNSNADISVV